jgi:two-component system chemotaxis response regulator CheY
MKKRILLVDNQPIIRMMVKDILTDDGHEVIGEAKDGLQGFDLYCDLKPDLVIVDIKMPRLNGVEMIKLVNQYDASAKIIICSDMPEEEMIQETLKCGIRDYIRKPFTQDKLVNSVNKII